MSKVEAWSWWAAACIGLFILFPLLFASYIRAESSPVELEQMKVTALAIWWAAVKLGLPAWIIVSGCLIFVVKNHKI